MVNSSGDVSSGPGDQRGAVPDPAPSTEDAGQGSLFTGIAAVCDTAARLTGADGAAVAVLTSAAVRELVHATDALSQQLDELQFTLGEGPCLDAYLHGEAVRYPRLDFDAALHRWPAFAVEAADLGVGAVFAFPVPGRDHPVGVLELYRHTSGDDLNADELHSAMVCAIAIGDTLQSNWNAHLAAAAGVDAAIDAAAVAGARLDHPDNPFTRSQVHVAAGMIAVQLAITTAEALDRLRAHSYADRRSIALVAGDVVARRTSFVCHRDTPEEDQ
jgi:GAF domain-containing protein